MEKLEKILKELKNENLYRLLHIKHSRDEETVKKAYKWMMKKFHPDKNKEEKAVEIFQRAVKAYEILQDPEMKALYDSLLDRQEIKEKRVKVLGEKRKRFVDDLKKREQDLDRNKTNGNHDFTNRSQFKRSKQDEADYDKTIPKVKTFDEKLSESGVKIKWSKDCQLIFNKEILYSYFKEYGTIEDIVCNENEHKAFILFLSNKSVNSLISEYPYNQVLSKIFKIKKVSKKAIPEDNPLNYDKIKSAYLDSNTLNTLKNMRMMKNVEFMNESKEKTEKEVKMSQNNPATNNSTAFDKGSTLKINFNMSLEDFEKATFDKLKMKFKK